MDAFNTEFKWLCGRTKEKTTCNLLGPMDTCVEKIGFINPYRYHANGVLRYNVSHKLADGF